MTPERQLQVLDGAGDGTNDRAGVEHRFDHREVPGQRDKAGGRFDRGYAAQVRRLAQASTRVGPQPESRSTGGDDGRLPTRAPPGDR